MTGVCGFFLAWLLFASLVFFWGGQLWGQKGRGLCGLWWKIRRRREGDYAGDKQRCCYGGEFLIDVDELGFDAVESGFNTIQSRFYVFETSIIREQLTAGPPREPHQEANNEKSWRLFEGRCEKGVF